jgi:OmpA-OmpF porin, OOP family
MPSSDRAIKQHPFLGFCLRLGEFLMLPLRNRALLFVSLLCIVLTAASAVSIIHRGRRILAQTAPKAHNGAAQSSGNSSGPEAPTASRVKDSTPTISAEAVTAITPGASSSESGDAAPASAPPVAAAPIDPTPATGDQAHDWALKYERSENGSEADLVVRTGDINNLGFGWPSGFDPFSGKSTPVHRFPWTAKQDEPEGTDRIMLGSSVDPAEELHDPVAYNQRGSDGYSSILSDCSFLNASHCKAREESMPRAIILPVRSLPPKVQAVLLQVFVDDFQSAHFHSHFQVSMNGTRIPSFEEAFNALDQTGPIGKLITLRLLPEYWPLLKSGDVKLLVDDPTTKVRDGYAVDFVRILVNPHNFKYLVSLTVSVRDADKGTPIAAAGVNAALESAVTDRSGNCALKGLPAGLVVATASAPGYDSNSAVADLPAGQVAHAEIRLHRHEETAAALERSIQQTGSATIYGIHFDTDSAKLRPDSLPALNAILELIGKHADARWLISGHTDNQGNDALNEPLSERRAESVVVWLKEHGVDASRLSPEGFGATRPVADNATAGGRALNRRVEVALEK